MATATKSRSADKLSYVKPEPKVKKTTITIEKVAPQKGATSVQDEWDKELATPRSKELLGKMAAKALAAHKAGKTERGGFGK